VVPPLIAVIFSFLARYNNNFMNLDTRLTISRFLTLAKPGQARLVAEEVRGKIAKGYVIVDNPSLMAERFANWPNTPSGVLKFTQKFGPLLSTSIVKGEFVIELKKWYGWHRLFRDTWNMTTPAKLPTLESMGISDIGELGRSVRLGEQSFLTFNSGSAELLVKDMWTLLDVCLATIPMERLRICKAPECQNPYFVAHHMKQTLCNAVVCKRWNINRLKLEYWDREKDTILSERQRKRKEEKNVPKKAR
jgi:hypothetical protein